MTESHDQPWLHIEDAHLSSAELVARVEEQLQKRRDRLGPLTRRFPTFQATSTALDDPHQTLEEAHDALRDALRRLNELPPPPTHANLATSPATRVPLLGRLWALIRNQAHHLVLFYVNRQQAHQAQVNLHTANVLHELAALLIAQQQEIEHLQSRLEQSTDAGAGDDAR